MAIYFVTVGTNEYKVEIQQDQFKVNGQAMDLKLQPLNKNGLYLLELGKRKLEMLFKTLSQNQMAVMVDSHHMVVQVDRDSGKSVNQKNQTGKGDLAAPMPGIVLAVHVTEGQTVARNDLLITLESMKMQMEMRAPADGVIGKIGVAAGKKVDKGCHLIQIIEK